jgi:D-glycero-D-manno-heptose 1,7-bisphosphate phosphatase
MKLLVLDRDGTLNRQREDYVASPDEWEPIPGALEAVARLNQAGWHVVLATNQSGLGRGIFDMAALNAVHTKMHRALAAVGARVDAVFFCPHAPGEGCACRKPAPGLFQQIADHTGIAPKHMVVAGHALRHVQAGAALGCNTHLLLTGRSFEWRERVPTNGGVLPEGLCPGLPTGTRAHLDLPTFAAWLLQHPSTHAGKSDF